MHDQNQLEILYSDPHLLGIDKPPGLLSLPDGYDPYLPHVRRLLEPEWGRLWIVHRLDKYTSGVMILARSASAHRDLSHQFSEHQVRKIYHALVEGQPAWDNLQVTTPLRSGVGRRKRTAADEQHGKPAETNFSVIKRFPAACMIEARPLTGRTHQIRAHLYTLGLHILSDPLYGEQISDFPIFMPRLALHALQLTCQHPETGADLTIRASYPADFRQALDALQYQ